MVEYFPQLQSVEQCTITRVHTLNSMLSDGSRDHKAGIICPRVARSRAEDGIADCDICVESIFVDSLDETTEGRLSLGDLEYCFQRIVSHAPTPEELIVERKLRRL